MFSRLSPLAALHTAVLLFGVAGLFGKWVAASPVVIVCARTAIASLTFLLVLRWQRVWPTRPQGADWGLLPLTGAILALHWFAFFQAIQASTVAIALLAYATAPVFAALLEPLAFRERVSWRAVTASAVTLAGIALIVPHWTLADANATGVAWGVVSGLTFALLSLLNRSLVRRHAAVPLALYQDAVAMFLLLPLVATVWIPLTGSDVALLLLLGVVCTALAHTLYISSLNTLRARTAAIVSALEPVYGILLAALLLGEVPTLRTALGGVVVLTAVLWVTLRPEGAPRSG